MDELTVPRGANISVLTTEAITTSTHNAGDAFSAEVNVPMRAGTTIYVPLMSRVYGEVISVVVDEEGRDRISLQLNELHLPGGMIISLKTVPLVRQSQKELEAADVTVRTGLDVDIDALLGRVAPTDPMQQRNLADSLSRLSIPQNSHLVFTLEEDITIPAP